ncbi:integrase [Gossypium australe]|uniref:Integrase n=1 Tax=Gossypium australe TaxID=47621 RepID=A0A5B6VEK8_9ROSI|nr:integrase [Gossypium australe]
MIENCKQNKYIRIDFSRGRIAELCVSEIVRLYRVRVSIISNRDPRSISRLWRKLQEALSTRLYFTLQFILTSMISMRE